MVNNTYSHTWGGDWTDQKLEAFEKYVKAYLTIMNQYRDKYNWKLIYFDGFAGSGERKQDSIEDDDNKLDFDGLFTESDTQLYQGAAERVLNIDLRGFDYYYFIDKDPDSGAKLKEKLSKYESPEKHLVFRTGDANEQLLEMTKTLSQNTNYKAMVLLDPFGMQLDWKNIETLKGCGVDLWILVPTGVIVNRLLDKRGELKHIEKLQSFFGMTKDEIMGYFYKKETQLTLFGEDTKLVKIEKPIENIAKLYIDQLKKVFKYVTEEPLVLKNSRQCPIFHFVFASNNQSAYKIASQIIPKI